MVRALAAQCAREPPAKWKSPDAQSARWPSARLGSAPCQKVPKLATNVGAIMSFGQWLRASRKERGLSIAALAKATHYSPGYLSRVESGKRPATAELAQACDKALAMNGDLVALVTARDDPPSRAAPMQLPPSASLFAGRGEELRLLDELLAESGLEQLAPRVVICAVEGMGGVGKSALVVHWAHRARDRFSDGVLFADLLGYDPRLPPAAPDEILDGFLRALGQDPAAVEPPGQQRSAQFRTLVAGKSVLLVLDNARTSEQVRPLLPGTGTCMVVVTSRDRLTGLCVRDGARSVALDELTTPEALELLRTVVGAQRVSAEEDAARQLCRACGHLPLALRIVADQNAARPHLTIGELAGQLADERSRLDALAAHDDESTAVRATFSWSYDNLPGPQARAFRLLALHPGDWFCAQAAAELLDEDQAGTQRLLESLASRHLLQPLAAGRYRFHDLLRAYATECLARHEDAADQQSAWRRLASWYLHTAASAGRRLVPSRRPNSLSLPPAECRTPLVLDDYASALEWCEAERANLMAVIRQAGRSGPLGTAAALVHELWGFFYLRRHVADWRAAGEVAVDAALRLGNQVLLADALSGLGSALSAGGDAERARVKRHEALAAYRAIGDDHGAATQLNNIGDSLMAAGRHREALDYFRQALPMQVSADPSWDHGITMANLGEAYLALGEPDEAAAHLKGALGELRGPDTGWVVAIVLTHLGKLAAEQGRPDEAIGHFSEARDMNRQVGNEWGMANTLTALGEVLSDNDREEEARDAWTKALAIYERLGDAQAAAVRTLLAARRTRA
jgi:tetratricopeptide (TPR) repeat protein/transcriptional regulator with XRE-family HTH domain